MKLAILLAFTMGIPFPFCLYRMKKYRIPFTKMLLIYMVFSMVGLAGACVGSAAAGGSIGGKRLYGLMLFDTAAVFIMSIVLRMKVSDLGDFVSVPIMAVCASAKLDCLMNNCCHGFAMYYQGENPVYFPSPILEMVIWAAFVVFLLRIEKKGNAAGTLWPIAMVWFGTARYLVDFLRSSSRTIRILSLEIAGGRLWSLVALLVGVIFLYFSLRKNMGRSPKMKEYIKAIFGK